MAGKLTARRVETAKPGKYSDGGNLYLIVSETGARKWVLRFTWRGRAKEMGLGSAVSVPLADARERAATARRKIAQGLNPIDERKRTKPKAVWTTPPRRTTPTDAYEAERWLTELADWLGQQDYDLGAWFAEAVRRRNELGGTLERTLGLLHETAGTPPIKERPRSDKERRRRTKLALDAHPHVTAVPAGKKIPWKVIACAIGFEGSPNDLRKWYDEFYSQAEDIARQITRRLKPIPVIEIEGPFDLRKRPDEL